MQNLFRGIAGFVALAGLAGCQSSLMVKGGGEAHAPAPGKAMVVFMRPSSFGGAIQSSVYDTAEPEDRFIGIVSAGTKLAYQAEPGDHLFMVQAENADFMIAHLDAGKTYYVDVKPRIGVWKARFSLIPIHDDPTAEYSLRSEAFAKWNRDTDWVTLTPEAEQWYRSHAADIRTKKLDYIKKWDAMLPADKAVLTLHAKDGL